MEITREAKSGEAPLEFQAPRHHNHRWNVKRRRKVACDRHLSAGDSASREGSGHKFISTPPLMYVMKYVVPPVVALASLKYQAKPDSLFLENPAPVWCFVAATSVYWLIVGATKQMTIIDPKYLETLLRAALASGILSALSLVSVFLPYPVSLVPLMIWIPLPVVLAWPKAYNLFHRGIKGVTDKIQPAIVVSDRGVNSTEEASLPV